MSIPLKNTPEYWEYLRRLEWERVKREGVRFEEELCSGYLHEGKRKYDMKTIPFRGEPEVSWCPSCVPPWEVCEKCPNTF